MSRFKVSKLKAGFVRDVGSELMGFSVHVTKTDMPAELFLWFHLTGLRITKVYSKCVGRSILRL